MLFVWWIGRVRWLVIVALCLTLGLAPFNPPHLWEKLRLLAEGRLSRVLDGLDLLLHGLPWLLLLAKALLVWRPEE